MQSSMARRLRNQGVPLGEIFSFTSGLYFRGKLAYAEKFAEVAGDVRAAYVITSSAGLIPCERLLLLSGSAKFLRAKLIAQMKNTGPLDRDSAPLSELVGTDCQVVLLGTIASSKYVQPLLESFGEQLFFPAEFVGRGDMSRGGLMLRCVSAGVAYIHAFGPSGSPWLQAPKAGPSASGGLSVFAASWSAAQLLIDMNAHERETEILDGHS